MHQAGAHTLHLSRLSSRAEMSLSSAPRVQSKSDNGQTVQTEGEELHIDVPQLNEFC